MKTMTTWAKSSITWLFALLLGATFLFSVLSIERYYPSRLDMEINLQVAGALAVGLFLMLLLRPVRWLTPMTLALWALTAVIALQPLINPIAYPDNLLFPVSSLLLVSLLAVVVGNLSEAEKYQVILPVLLVTLMLASLLLVVTQMAQVFHWAKNIRFIVDSSRPYSNIAQPNQAAYVLSLGAAGAMYYLFRAKHWSVNLLLLLLLLWFYIGVGLSSSRGGLILSVAGIVAMTVFVKRPWRKKVLLAVGLLVLLAVGYWIADYLLTNKATYHATTFDRYVAYSKPSQSSRLMLQYEAWAYFKDHWLTGVGWANFARAGIDYANQLHWIAHQHHSHFIFSQIAAELGVLGLLPVVYVVWLIIKSLRWQLDDKAAVVATVIGLSVLYSLSEHPMWYLRYLFLFVVFMALWDKGQLHLKHRAKKTNKSWGWRAKALPLTLCLAVCVGSVFYYQRYKVYGQIYYSIGLDYFSPQQKAKIMQQLPKTFGFSHYEDFMRYKRLPVVISELSQAERQIQADRGERVLTTDSSYSTLIKQADLLVYLGEDAPALRLYQAAYSRWRKSVEKHLSKRTTESPQVFQVVNKAFNDWRGNNTKPNK